MRSAQVEIVGMASALDDSTRMQIGKCYKELDRKELSVQGILKFQENGLHA
jgi:hypothetical protein